MNVIFKVQFDFALEVWFSIYGGEILRIINGQDHQTSMAGISVSICSIWSWSLRSSEGIVIAIF